MARKRSNTTDALKNLFKSSGGYDKDSELMDDESRQRYIIMVDTAEGD